MKVITSQSPCKAAPGLLQGETETEAMTAAHHSHRDPKVSGLHISAALALRKYASEISGLWAISSSPRRSSGKGTQDGAGVLRPQLLQLFLLPLPQP